MKHSDINIKIEWMEYIQHMQSSKAQDEVLLAIIHYLQDGTDDMFDLSSLEATLTWQVLQPMVHRVYVNRQNGNKGGAPKGNKNNRYSKAKYNQSTTESTTEVQPKVQPKYNRDLSNTEQDTIQPPYNLDLERKKETEEKNLPSPDPTLQEKEDKEINKEREKDSKKNSETKPKPISRMTPEEAREFLVNKIKESADQYPKEMLNDFFYYWASPVDESLPDSPLLFQKQKAWMTAGRLRTWYKKNIQGHEHRTD